MLRQRLPLLFAAFFLLAGGLFASAAADGAWLGSVPSRERDKTNPYQGQADAIAAGRKLYVDHCLHCHGENAEGTRKRPALTTARVQQEATAGDLHWLLVNGNMKRGMPPWAKLPDPQLWQIISYLKTLQQ